MSHEYSRTRDPLYTHDCCDHAPFVDRNAACPRCGRPGTFEGWSLEKYDLQTRFVHRYGLRPTGPHRPFVDADLAPLRSTCTACRGTGVSPDQTQYRYCRVCEGGGGAWAAPDAQLWALYHNLLTIHPEAAVGTPRWFRDFATITSPSPHTLPANTPAPKSKPQRTASRKRRTPQEVQQAFMTAERKLGADWKVKGAGHCRRASLKSHYARQVRLTTSSWKLVRVRSSRDSRILFPLAIVLYAARLLDVDCSQIMGKEY